MQVHLQVLSRQAIDSALNKNWESAVGFNKQILEINPDDKNAKIRLGRAYIKQEMFAEAKKIFKEILEKDPINNIALKNLKLASENNPDIKSESKTKHTTKVLIKEPGTTTQVTLPADEKVLSKLEPGQEIRIKSFKTKLCLFLNDIELGFVKDDIALAVYGAKKEGWPVSASVIKPNQEHFTVLLKCKQPIFRSEKQLEKPYMKTTLIDEPKLELTKTEDEDHQ